MSLKERKSVVEAMRIVADAAERADDAALRRLLSIYNYLHRQVDGENVRLPNLSKSTFMYDSRLQMVRAA